MNEAAELRSELAQAQAENATLRALLDKVGLERAGLQGELMAANLQNEAMRNVVDAAHAMIGKNVGRPDVYKVAGDSDKYCLAVALQTWLKRREGRP